MSASFESEKNKKAFFYTISICGTILLLFFLISWTVVPPTLPTQLDLIEINLGNNQEGFGEVQPLIKGDNAPTQESVVATPQSAATNPETTEEKVTPDDNAEADAAPVTKPVITKPKVVVKPKTITPVKTPTPTPRTPKITYDGPGKKAGNNDTEDNGYKYQGKKPGGGGDDGDPSGNKDSYGNNPGGKVGGPIVTSGNRKLKVVRDYSFTAELKKATIYAQIKVAPSGQGIFIKIEKHSTSFEQSYANAIRGYLGNMQFDKSDEESIVTVQFNFTVN